MARFALKVNGRSDTVDGPPDCSSRPGAVPLTGPCGSTTCRPTAG
jgi:hypothetical protein